MLQRIPKFVDFWLDFADEKERTEILFLEKRKINIRKEIYELRNTQRQYFKKHDTKRYRINRTYGKKIKSWRIIASQDDIRKYDELQIRINKLHEQKVNVNLNLRTLRERCRSRQAKIHKKGPRRSPPGATSQGHEAGVMALARKD